MVVQPYVSETTAAAIAAAKARLFATSKQLGRTVSLVLWRDNEEDGTPVMVPAQQVLVRWANREAAARSGEATFFTGMEGELRKEWPMDIQKGDRFTLPDGVSGKVTTPPILTGAFVRVAFEVEA